MDTSTPAIKLEGLTKSFGRRRVLNDLHLTVPFGGVHALLGPNGSGKTTTLRIALGLTRCKQGTVEVLSHRLPQGLPEVSHRVGALLEGTRLYPYLSTRRNLQILARAAGLPQSRVDDTLDRLHLGDYANDKIRGLSLGVRQRIGMALAMLKKPDVYILDEPTNGLDPASMADLRNLMRELTTDGATVLLSTHLLHEVQQIADTVTIIDHGTVVFDGDITELQHAARPTISVGVADPPRAARILRHHGFEVTQTLEMLEVHGAVDPSSLARITAVLAREGLYLHELTATTNLESSFLQLTDHHD